MTNNQRVRFTLRLPSDLIEKLKKEAINEGVSINALILNILWKWSEENNIN